MHGVLLRGFNPIMYTTWCTYIPRDTLLMFPCSRAVWDTSIARVLRTLSRSLCHVISTTFFIPISLFLFYFFVPTFHPYLSSYLCSSCSSPLLIRLLVIRLLLHHLLILIVLLFHCIPLLRLLLLHLLRLLILTRHIILLIASSSPIQMSPSTSPTCPSSSSSGPPITSASQFPLSSPPLHPLSPLPSSPLPPPPLSLLLQLLS